MMSLIVLPSGDVARHVARAIRAQAQRRSPLRHLHKKKVEACELNCHINMQVDTSVRQLLTLS